MFTQCDYCEDGYWCRDDDEDEPCLRFKKRILTNAEKIQLDMSEDELAEFLSEISGCNSCVFDICNEDKSNCKYRWLAWLQGNESKRDKK